MWTGACAFFHRREASRHERVRRACLSLGARFSDDDTTASFGRAPFSLERGGVHIVESDGTGDRRDRSADFSPRTTYLSTRDWLIGCEGAAVMVPTLQVLVCTEFSTACAALLSLLTPPEATRFFIFPQIISHVFSPFIYEVYFFLRNISASGGAASESSSEVKEGTRHPRCQLNQGERERRWSYPARYTALSGNGDAHAATCGDDSRKTCTGGGGREGFHWLRRRQ